MPIIFKAIIPKKLNISKNSLMVALKAIIQDADEQFAKTYDTWNSDHKPDFEQEFSERGGELTGSVLADGRGSSANPYPFVTKGTRVRYATMTQDFQAKTRPRVIGSGPGKGGLLYVDTRRPRPGIEARRFEEEIAKIEKKRFLKIAKDELRIIAKKSGHGI